MTAENNTESQLENLEQRWEAEPSPHLSLQLADLYRQHGRLADALPVLERGLAEHPGHVSVRVALGRYRLEGGDAVGAEEVLLAVVEEDPAHLVANKLLVRTYVALGDLQRAADRLDLYAVLNDSDPEVDTLRAALLDPPPNTGSAEALAEPFGAVAAPPEPAVDLTRVRRPVRRQLRGALGRPPFGELLIAPLEPSPLAELFGALGEAAGVLAAAPPVELSEMSSEDDEISPEFIDALIEQEPEPEVEVESEPEPEPETEVEVEVESEPEFEPGPDEIEVEAVEREAPEPETEPAIVEEAQADLPPREVDGGSGATATLGALYLAQDHLDDAQATFQQVLERDPEDAEARAGLAEVTRRRAAHDDIHAPRAPATGQSGRKIELLESYLDRIRRAADRLSA